jgi:hypothetical protein
MDPVKTITLLKTEKSVARTRQAMVMTMLRSALVVCGWIKKKKV